MRLLDTEVKYFDNNSKGISSIINQWGSMINILDDCLVDGGEYLPVISISTTEDILEPERYWLSTIVLDSNHGFLKDLSVVEITGCTEQAYNTTHRVQDVSVDRITIAFDKKVYTEKPQDSLLEDVINIRLAPLGYNKVFEGDNKAVYRSGNLNNNGMYLRVDSSCPVGYDPTWTKFARVSMYSDMDFVDDFLVREGRFKVPYYPEEPYRAEIPRGSGPTGYYGESKWYYSTTNVGQMQESHGSAQPGPFEFNIIGDDKTFYFLIRLVGVTQYWQKVCYCFGEYSAILTKPSTDTHILCAHESNIQANSYQGWYQNPGFWESGNVFARTNNSSGKYIVDTSFQELSNNRHVKVDFMTLLSTSMASGRDTSISYNPYYTDLNFLEVYLRAFFPRATKLQGSMRGYHMIGNNLQENPYSFLKEKLIISPKNTNIKFVLMHTLYANSSNVVDTFISFKLNNWS